MTVQELREAIQEQKRIEAQIRELSGRRKTLSETEAFLRAVWQKEEQDVVRLEEGSLSGFWFALTGKKEQQLDKEKQEAYAAAVKHRTAFGELQEVEQELERLTFRRKPVEELERQLSEALKRQKELMKAENPEKSDKILKAEREISLLEGQLKEINEAIAAGNRAKSIVQEVKKSLSSAENWGTWDILGGGMFATMAKHSHLDSAQRKIEELQTCLLRFKTELADVELNADIKIQVDGFLQFADYFWDGLFTDWAVQNKIVNAQNEVQQTESGIIRVLSRLEEMRRETEAELGKKKSGLEEYVSQ